MLAVAQFFRLSPPFHPARAQEGQQVPDVLRARVIELVDEQGQVRAALNIVEDEEAILRFRDASGAIRIKLGASEGGSGLVRLGDRSEPAVHLLAQRSATSVTFSGKDKQKLVLKP